VTVSFARRRISGRQANRDGRPTIDDLRDEALYF
jgi:hypothetical protein